MPGLQGWRPSSLHVQCLNCLRPFFGVSQMKSMCCCRVECCIRCLAQGVSATHIIDGRQQHSLLLELLTGAGVGTMIVG